MTVTFASTPQITTLLNALKIRTISSRTLTPSVGSYYYTMQFDEYGYLYRTYDSSRQIWSLLYFSYIDEDEIKSLTTQDWIFITNINCLKEWLTEVLNTRRFSPLRKKELITIF